MHTPNLKPGGTRVICEIVFTVHLTNAHITEPQQCQWTWISLGIGIENGNGNEIGTAIGLGLWLGPLLTAEGR